MVTPPLPSRLEHEARAPVGLYDPRRDRDSCGIGFIAHLAHPPTHGLLGQGLSMLCRLSHRGAVGADARAGDGVGVLTSIPDRLLRASLGKRELPPLGRYGVAVLFLAREEAAAARQREAFAGLAERRGLRLLHWRCVPLEPSVLGHTVRAAAPRVMQGILAAKDASLKGRAFERALYALRKQAESAQGRQGRKDGEALKPFTVVSCSSRTIVYKGLILAEDFARFYPDLADTRYESNLALIHQRFSTNTFPSWRLAQPFSMLCHNGEINTLRGNVNWLRARKSDMEGSALAGPVGEGVWPLLGEGLSDSACLDEALAFLYAGGYDLARAVLTLIPEAWQKRKDMNEDVRSFYAWHALAMEPWDGPAALAFTDGILIGGMLDRNGLRPARYLLTRDGRLALSSESGVLDVADGDIVKKWRLQPGKLLLADVQSGRILEDGATKARLASLRPWRRWLSAQTVRLKTPRGSPSGPALAGRTARREPRDLLSLQRGFGYNREDLDFYLKPMARDGREPVGAMGDDAPPSVLSNHAPLLYDYFKQCFAQVTNPAIDPLREGLVMSLMSVLGGRRPLFDDGDGDGRGAPFLILETPLLEDNALASVRASGLKTVTLDACCEARRGASAASVATEGMAVEPVEPMEVMAAALRRLEEEAVAAVRDGASVLILSDREVGRERMAVPMLLSVSCVHHALLRHGLRTRASLVAETGEAREPHHIAVLAGYGAEAVNPWLALASVAQAAGGEADGGDVRAFEARTAYMKALSASLLKVMSKMGISTYQSYCAAQIFDTVGLASDFVERYFPGTAAAVEGVGLSEIASETARRHDKAWKATPLCEGELFEGGVYAFRLRGEAHAWNPRSVAELRHAVYGNLPDAYRRFAERVNAQDERLLTLRGLMEFRESANPVPLAEVEPAASLVKRFATGAMSFGAISKEAHTTLAEAMNSIGAKSNTGEGGEEPERYRAPARGPSLRSAIKQVASGRFGVTAAYLVNADDIQIKICQGAKPGEGGQLPGHKVSVEIGRVRHAMPGVGLISPPPHHDIYSIEDLAQLIFDLKNVNPKARISVKLASESGVGVVAAGVAKARADHVTIAGCEGGTGASPLTSIKHAGLPWELGLAETQHTLVANDLRDRIYVQVDGGFRTGRDVVIGAMLGADEFGFATAPLITLGCLMMRKCHLNTCPVGIATQDPVLRKRFTGRPEHVVNYFFFVAEEARALMAALGFRRFEDMVGRSDRLRMRGDVGHWKARGLDFTKLLHAPALKAGASRCRRRGQKHLIDDILDHKVLARARKIIEKGRGTLRVNLAIANTDRAFGAFLSGEIARRHGRGGLPHGAVRVTLKGSAGQSFGAFLSAGVALSLEGEANDYVGKGLSGGVIAVYPPPGSGRIAHEHCVIGNTVLYGATGGALYASGVAGERFAVRNSGACAVVEGVGDHGCEYMTGGVVAVLGATGRNFAAGMSGGIAYVYDPDGAFAARCNPALVALSPVVAALEGDEEEGGMETETHDGLMVAPLARDAWRLRRLLRLHLRHTGSARARFLLEEWRAQGGCFVKVTPHDLRRAFGGVAFARASGVRPALQAAAG